LDVDVTHLPTATTLIRMQAAVVKFYWKL